MSTNCCEGVAIKLDSSCNPLAAASTSGEKVTHLEQRELFYAG
jgi:hypothetical protein